MYNFCILISVVLSHLHDNLAERVKNEK